MDVELIRGLYGYHHWANRRLFDVAHGLGAEAGGREMGAHWSFPTLTRTFGHIYGAERLWLQRFRDDSTAKLAGGRSSLRLPRCGRRGRAQWNSAPTRRIGGRRFGAS